MATLKLALPITSPENIPETMVIADNTVENPIKQISDNSLFNFMQAVISRLARRGRIRTSETYKCTLRSFRDFRGDKDIPLQLLSTDIIEDYQAWLKQKGLCLNTISFYLRILRALYNRAVDQGKTMQNIPFRHVFTGQEKTNKRALPLSFLKRIKALDLSHNRKLDFARDMFLFSFFTRGMSFIDMAYLQKTDIHFNELSYRRHKTGKLLQMRWEPQMAGIAAKWSRSESRFLLDIIRDDSKARSQYLYRSHAINGSLKEIARMVGLPSLSFYAARHSWASIAKEKNVPISIISEGMGHDNETTTRIYLASLSTAAIDKANSMIIKSLN